MTARSLWFLPAALVVVAGCGAKTPLDLAETSTAGGASGAGGASSVAGAGQGGASVVAGAGQGGASAVAGAGQGAKDGLGGCVTMADCPQPHGCQLCPDGMEVCDTAVCVQGACQIETASCPADACAAQDARSEGACKSIVGVAWNGTSCTALQCSCAGSDCGDLYASLSACQAAHASCPSPSCSTTATGCPGPWTACTSASDCPALVAQCPGQVGDGISSPPGDCVQGQCQYPDIPPGCPPTSCAGRTCGASCTYCPDPSGGECSIGECDGAGNAGPDGVDCPAPSCDPQQAASSGTSTATAGYGWNGTSCQAVVDGCVGVDCINLFLTEADCQRIYSPCITREGG